jgi:peptide/nickel transport system ATP-binding protein
VKDLRTYYQTSTGPIKAVDGVSFKVDRGETLGIAGESGCGKSTIAFSSLRILPVNGEIIDGKILLDGRDIVNLSENEMRKIRWKRIALIFQSAMNALNPVVKIGDQIIEALKVHNNISQPEMTKKVKSYFELVGLNPNRMNHYPHEFSGGMKQRAIIAMSLICNPEVIIADEPTTALDVVVQDQILKKIKELQDKLKMAIIYISHDLSVLAEICDKIAIMYAGNIVEYADIISIFKNSHHPYTMALLRAFPSLQGPLRELKTIGGAPPDLKNPPSGCRFEPRCPYAEEICKKIPPQFEKVAKEHFSMCHFALDPQIKKFNL